MATDDEIKRQQEEARREAERARQEELNRILREKEAERERIKNLADEIERRGRGTDDKPQK